MTDRRKHIVTAEDFNKDVRRSFLQPDVVTPVPLNPSETVDHPTHYGGADNPYEAIKVIDAWGLDFSLGNAVKYICRAGRKGNALEDLKKAEWYLRHKIQQLEKA